MIVESIFGKNEGLLWNPVVNESYDLIYFIFYLVIKLLNY